MNPTNSEIEVESRIIWLWTLGNLETWIEVGLYGHGLTLELACRLLAVEL
jgi:hypothetical protein